MCRGVNGGGRAGAGGRGCRVKGGIFTILTVRSPRWGEGGAIFMCGRYIGQCVGRSARVMVKMTKKHSNITTTGTRFYITSCIFN